MLMLESMRALRAMTLSLLKRNRETNKGEEKLKVSRTKEIRKVNIKD